MKAINMDDQFLIELTSEKLAVSKAIEFVSSANCGATSIFIGSTRINENNGSRDVQSLYYEAYEEMALKMMYNLARNLLVNYHLDAKLHKVYIGHRLGEVKLADASIIIAVSSPHRSSGHQLVMEILNKIKKQVPIWKKVVYQTTNGQDSNQTESWSGNSEAYWLKK